MFRSKPVRIALITLLVLFVVANALAALHAYKFTHFTAGGKKIDSLHLTTANKIKMLFLGTDNPRPVNTKRPTRPYEVVQLKSNTTIEGWYIPVENAKGTVLLCHGYTSNKSAMLNRAEMFLNNGYNCMLFDFMGSGGSGGNSTTIGFKEANDVKVCYNYIKSRKESNVYLYGSSMGAVAIMKAIKDYELSPKGIIIECPFSTMYQTVCDRFDILHVPEFPLAGLLVFWGGVENGFWAFDHRPVDYAKDIKCPVLLQYGEKDTRVIRKEIDEIYANIPGKKQLVIYPQAGHDDYLSKCGNDWCKNITAFLNTTSE